MSRKKNRLRRAPRRSQRRAKFQHLEQRQVLTTSLPIDVNLVGASNPTDLVEFGDQIYFVADDGQSGRELWVTDGTVDGTQIVSDINAGEDSSTPAELTVVGDTLYFTADDGENGRELWRTDGTEAGTVLVSDLAPGDDPDTGYPISSGVTSLTEFDGELYFTADDGEHGNELWKTDGTEDGTVLVSDINTLEDEDDDSATASSNPFSLTVMGDTLYFSADDGQSGRELWRTDGSDAGTTLVADIWEGSTSDVPNSGYPALLTVVGDELFFVANDGDTGGELWKTDGSEAGTTQVADINPGEDAAFTTSDSLIEIDGLLYFSADNGVNGTELWVSDGTASGTFLVRDINPGAEGSLNQFASFTEHDGKLFFSADDGENGRELWSSDGTAAGTVLVKDIATGTSESTDYYGVTTESPNDSYPYYMSVVDGVLYFSAYSLESGRELWMTDGTEEGTVQVVDAGVDKIGSYPTNIAAIDGQLIYAATTENDREIHTLVDDERFYLTVMVDSEVVEIPHSIGVEEDGATAETYTLTDDGAVLFDDETDTTLGDFFDTWRTDAGLAGENPDALLTSTEVFGAEVDATNTLQMFVNGFLVDDYENYEVQDGDDIVIVYGSNTVVSLVTNVGAIIVELFEDDTPGTVENFLEYVNSGAYLDSIIHRSDPDFVVQGGGFTSDEVEFEDVDQIDEIDTNDPIENEPGISNTRGTIAMAKLSGDPDSATSQWFFNLSDDNVFLDEEANNEFTVFGQAVSMRTVDNIAQAPVNDTGVSPFQELPLNGDELIVVTSIEGQGDISGVQFLDLDADGLLDETDEPLAGVRVYLDENDNGVFDEGEISTLTDDEGRYLLQAEPGTYTVRTEFGGQATTSESYTVTVEIGSEDTGLNFGEALTDPPTNLTLLAISDTGVADDDGLTNLNNSSADTALQFTVDGAVEGYEVRLYANDVLIGTATATGDTVTVTTDGLTTLADGVQTITATFALGDLETDPSEAITVTVDATPPGAITTDPTNVVQVGQDPLSVDLDSPNEGTDGVVYSLVGAPDGMTIDPETGQLDWTPTTEQAVPTTVEVALSDEAGNETVLEYDLEVLGVAAARYDEYEVDEDDSLTVGAEGAVTLNDEGAPDGGSLTVELVDNVSNGTLTLNADGTFTYAPDPNFFGVDTFTYMATNATDDTNVALVTITVNGVPDPPAPEDDFYRLLEDAPLTATVDGGVLSNDVDVDGDTLTAQLETDVSNGTLEFNSDGSFVYTPDENYFGEDSFTYTVSDGEFTSDPVTVTLDIDPVNDAPVAVDDEYTVDEDGSLSIDAAEGLLANDFDIEGSAIEVTSTDGSANGTLAIMADGSFTYEPDDDFFGVVTLTYQITDGDLTGEGTLTINVTAQPDAPVAEDDAYTGVENGGSITTLDVLANDSDVDGDDTFTIVSVSAGSLGGVIEIADDGLSLEYTSPSDATGTETFTYTIEDEDGLTSTASVSVGLVETGEATLSGFAYVDADGDGLRESGEAGIPGVLISLVGATSGGEAVSLSVLTDSSGSYSFTNIPSGTYEIREQQPTAFEDGLDATTIPDAVAGDDVISSIVVSGDAVYTENNFGEQNLSAQYVSIAWFFASNLDSQAEMLREAVALAEELAGNTDLADAIRASAEGVTNTAPVAVADAYSTDEGVALSIVAADGLLVNDTDAEGDALSVTVVDNVNNGLLTVLTDGSFAYTPDTEFNGTDSFTYIVSDGLLASAETTVTITVDPVNDAPVALDDEYEANTGGTLTVGVDEGLLANDSDVDGDTISIVTNTTPDNGTLSLASDGSFLYTPEDDFEGEDSFTYSITDGELTSDTVEVTILVDSINDAPEAVADTYEVSEGGVLEVDAESGTLANDSDFNGDEISISSNTLPENGTLDLQSDGSFTYTPDEGFEGEDSFTYSITDGELVSPTVEVTILVSPVEEFELADDAQDGDVVGQLSTPTSLTDPVVYELYDESTAEQLLLAADDHLTGDSSAQVVIIEYLDLACPSCKAAHDLIEQLLEDYPENLLVVRRHLPLTDLHPNALEAAYAAEAAAAQGMFDEYVDALFETQGEPSQWDTAADPTSLLVTYADNLGLDRDQFIEDLESAAVMDRVQRDLDAAGELGLTATPSLYVNGEQIATPSDLAGYTDVVEEAIDAFDEPFIIDRLTGQILVDAIDLVDFGSGEPIELIVRVTDTSGASVLTRVLITEADDGTAEAASLVVETDLDDALGETEDWLVAL